MTPRNSGAQAKPIKVQATDPRKLDRFNPRNRIYVRKSSGQWTTLRRKMGWVFMLFFLLLPWLPWGDRPAVLFELAERKFYVFGLVIWPQDLLLLAFLFMIAAFALFFFTTYLGRVWCGYTCPQTIWTFMFIWVEEKIEGARNKRIKLDKAPWSVDKAGKKVAKHGSWLAMSLLTALTFISFFTPATELYPNFFTGNASGTVYFWSAFFTLATYGNAGWMREIMCLHMCPYARFQSVMFDKDTYSVGYNANRGEQRGPRGRKQNPKEMGLGDCIDCNLCVQVCPTGIDIRNGLQYECINCGVCAETCDDVMVKMGYDKGLISYTTERQLEGGASNVMRPKLVGYGSALLVMCIAFVAMVGAIKPLEVDVIRDRNMLFRETNEGLIENVYTLKLLNKSEQPVVFDLAVTGLEEYQWSGLREVAVGAGEVASIPVSVAVDPYYIRDPVTDIDFVVTAEVGFETVSDHQSSRFIGAGGR
ncbi:cytochrome c oxidase accessory protein FixG [Ferrimonas sediminum]|uniref:Cytochrome c oxidase accessory protein FixG n=1 Tax=Ferrimonas sediminum TaxID=718193 RepID=A0A1G9BY79_9GAMM|nr:cytochrome c oxidase accessory protein CcoG [Ferrimonas sediminum]SDK44426.1 cytochrome c oxidase accessory protein FixG [Ferrimonas sediminum]